MSCEYEVTTHCFPLITHDSSLTTLVGEENGRSDSVGGHCNADSQAHWRFSRRSFCLSQRQAFTPLLSDAAGLSLLRYRARAGSRLEQKVSCRSRHLEPVA